MLLARMVACRPLGLHGPDLARGPEVARLCVSSIVSSFLDILMIYVVCLPIRPGTCSCSAVCLLW